MAYMYVVGFCIACGQLFYFNPDRVPSIRARREGGRLINDPAAEREPICRNCFDGQNVIRKQRGEAEVKMLPGAYDPEEVP